MTKKWMFIVLLILPAMGVRAQRHARKHAKKIKKEKQISPQEKLYQTGVKYFSEGNYVMADSVFTHYLKQYSKDENAIFNLAVTRLYLKDTMGFCSKMSVLYNGFMDEAAGKYYFALCGTADTIFLNKNHEKSDPKQAEFMVITETHRYHNYKTVVVHQKKLKANVLTIGTGNTGYMKDSDVLAIYKLYPDGHRLFLSLLDDPDVETKNEKMIDDYFDNNPTIRQAEQVLQLQKSEWVGVEYVLDSTGHIQSIKDIEVSDSLSPEKKRKIEKYVHVIFQSMPPLTPRKFWNKPVNYLADSYVRFSNVKKQK